MANFKIAKNGNGKKPPVFHFSVDNVSTGPSEIPKNEYQLTYKLAQGDQKLIRTVLEQHGMTEVHMDSSYFSIMWTGSQVLASTLCEFTPNQKVNHFPRTTELSRKDKLVRNIQRLQQIMSYTRKRFDFLPQTYVIPGEFQEFERTFRREKGVWIVKPAALSRGRGIYLVNHPDQVPVSESVIVSQYISNPLLVNDHKFDLRLYVVVTSFDPIVIYLYDEGLARFATVIYQHNKENLKDMCMHLTNYSINRYSDQYIRCEDPNVDNYGNKWSFSAMLKLLLSKGYDIKKLMQKIEDVIIKTIISAEVPIAQAYRAFVPYRGNCFELYGFDILIDEDLKPWLIEVNMTPSLNCDAPIDFKIKSRLIVDLFNLLGIACQNPVEAKKDRKSNLSELGSRYIYKLKERHGRTKRPASSLNRKLTNEEIRVLVTVKEEYQRRGGFVRIFPAENTWHLYGMFLEDKSGFNKMLSEQLYGPSSIHPLSRHDALPQSTIKNSKSLNSISDMDANEVVVVEPSSKTTSSLLRSSKLDSVSRRSISCINLDVNDVNGQKELKQQVLSLLKQDKTLSVQQSRRAFAAYLQQLHKRLQSYMYKASWDQEKFLQVSQQIDLVLKFIQKASLVLAEKFTYRRVSLKLPIQEKLDRVTQILKNFINCYVKATNTSYNNCHGDKNSDSVCVSDLVFDNFILSASEEDLEEVLTTFTKLNNSASSFLGSSKPSSSLLLPRISAIYKPDKKSFLTF